MSATTIEASSPFKAPAHFSRKYGTHPNTIIRWFRDGVLFSDGTRRRPDHVRTPGGYRATEEAVHEFLESIKADRQRGDDAPAPAAKPKRQSERLDRANRALSEAGF